MHTSKMFVHEATLHPTTALGTSFVDATLIAIIIVVFVFFGIPVIVVALVVWILMIATRGASRIVAALRDWRKP